MCHFDDWEAVCSDWKEVPMFCSIIFTTLNFEEAKFQHRTFLGTPNKLSTLSHIQNIVISMHVFPSYAILLANVFAVCTKNNSKMNIYLLKISLSWTFTLVDSTLWWREKNASFGDNEKLLINWFPIHILLFSQNVWKGEKKMRVDRQIWEYLNLSNWIEYLNLRSDYHKYLQSESE